MNKEQHDIFIQEVERIIKTTVNGKIDKIDAKLDTYIIQDNEWKLKAQPAIDAFTNLRGSGKIVAATFALVGTVAGALFALKQLFFK